MNTVTLSGNLVRDPEVRYLQNGTAVATITIATSRKFTRQDGTTDEETSFIRCEAWDTAAENLADNFKKGDPMFVVGQLKNDNWEKDGVKHSSYKVRINDFGKVVRSKRRQATDVAVAQPVAVAAEENSGEQMPF